MAKYKHTITFESSQPDPVRRYIGHDQAVIAVPFDSITVESTPNRHEYSSTVGVYDVSATRSDWGIEAVKMDRHPNCGPYLSADGADKLADALHKAAQAVRFNEEN